MSNQKDIEKIYKECIEEILKEKIVENLLKEKFGENSIKIIREILEDKEIDLIIANKLQLDPSEVRIILYKMYDCRIVDFLEKKKEGIAWIDYYWWIRKRNFINYIREELTKEKNKLEMEKEEIEEYEFFFCKSCKSIFEYSVAVDLDFTCPYCKKDLEYLEDKSVLLEEISKKLDEINKILSKLSKVTP